jgi:predicted RNase H-like HicB family nuclease
LLIGGFHQFTGLGVCGLALKLRDVRTEVIREDDGSYAVACSALGVYSVGKTLKEAKRNFQDALDLHLSVLREKARRELATVVAR